jgi:hypothetical protein
VQLMAHLAGSGIRAVYATIGGIAKLKRGVCGLPF